MKIVFWGTPEFAVPTLEALASSKHEVLAVVTQPDRKRGRGGNLQPSPVKKTAKQHEIDVLSPAKIKSDTETKDKLNKLKADMYIVVAYGQILSKDLLSQPRFGCWNGHASLLPRWRGAAPIQWSLISGDPYTGVGIMQMEETLDTGPLLLQEEIKIGTLDNSEILSKKLSNSTARLFINALSIIEDYILFNKIDSLPLTSQDSIGKEVTYARCISKGDLVINWKSSASDIHRKVMGLYPNCYTTFNQKRIKILDSEPMTKASSKRMTNQENSMFGPGSLKEVINGNSIVVSTSTEDLLIKQAQVEGKKPVSGDVAAKQLKMKASDSFDSKTDV
ncbi:methionyl-tRNA formyltransferase [Prochlorococcus sp. MIT 1300]|uniref:methionyl-tRNA formyltransferase n=1 Tax=Prochlorococcus sp. MIT 1300 TaxID=3096218 RepID=UPI002A7476BF|nr:methionyl-tRNA formyltransferase [Prochlorococcus sp. MIT 1300]